jgi:hypothetical protein
VTCLLHQAALCYSHYDFFVVLTFEPRTWSLLGKHYHVSHAPGLPGMIFMYIISLPL